MDKDNEMKTLKVVFNNGSQYQYNKVHVQDYVLFKNSASQGKSLNQYIKAKGYEYEKLEDANIDSIDNELGFRMDGGIFVTYDGNTFIMKDNKDNIICERNVKLSEKAFETICSALEAVGKELNIEGKNFVDYGEDGEDKPF